MEINVTIATPDDQMWGSSDPEAENIDVHASYDHYCSLVADRLAAMWPDAEICVGWDDDMREDAIEISGHGYDGDADGYQNSIDHVIQTVHGTWEWVIANATA